MHRDNINSDAPLAGGNASSSIPVSCAAPVATSSGASFERRLPIEPPDGARRRLGEGGGIRATPLAKLLEPLRHDVADMGRAAARARAHISALARHAQSNGATRLLRGAAGLARRKPATILGAACLLGLALFQALRRSPAAAAPRPAARQQFDQSRLPRRDRPSGYFSARAEGSLTNTPKTRSIR